MPGSCPSNSASLLDPRTLLTCMLRIGRGLACCALAVLAVLGGMWLEERGVAGWLVSCCAIVAVILFLIGVPLLVFWLLSQVFCFFARGERWQPATSRAIRRWCSRTETTPGLSHRNTCSARRAFINQLSWLPTGAPAVESSPRWIVETSFGQARSASTTRFVRLEGLTVGPPH